MNYLPIVAAALVTSLAATSGSAKPVPVPTPVLGETACKLSDITGPASACGGWYKGNLNGGNADKKADSAKALNDLLGVNTYTGANLTFLEGIGSLSGNVVNFATPLFGTTIVSFHVGAANGEPNHVGYQATAFYVFDAGNLVGGLDTIGFNIAGLSNARLYSTGTYTPPAVPEPASWGLLIAGFGVVGSAMRRRKARTTLSFA